MTANLKSDRPSVGVEDAESEGDESVEGARPAMGGQQAPEERRAERAERAVRETEEERQKGEDEVGAQSGWRRLEPEAADPEERGGVDHPGAEEDRQGRVKEGLR